MTKVELIRKIAKRSGVPDSEAKVFFEIFLYKISLLLQPAQALKLNGFGYFQLKRSLVKKILKDGEKPNYTDVILFSPFNEEENHEEIIFNIPSVNVENFNSVDSYFSLSFGKMVIPLQGVNDTDFYLMPTGLELKKLIEAKVNKLITVSEILTDYVKGGEILKQNIDNSNENQIDINWNESEDDNQIENDYAKQSENNSEFGHVAWDFGDNLSKQIEEESILDDSSEVNPLNWNSEISLENKEENIEPLLSENNLTDSFTTKQFDDRVEHELNKFERVKSITSEFLPEEKELSLTKSELDLSWNFGAPKTNVEQVKNTFTEFAETNLSDYQNSDLNDELMDQSDEVIEEEIEINPKSIHTESEKKSDNKFSAEEYSYSRKRSPFVFFIAMATIITVSAFVILYFTKTNFFNLTNKIFNQRKELGKVAQAEVIDRTFDVPITYPYDKSSFLKSSSEIAPGALNNIKTNGNLKQISQKNNLSELLNDSNSSKTTKQKSKGSLVAISDNQVNSNYVKIKDNIFKSNNEYIVQVSSWHSSSIANKEMKKFEKKSLNSFIEKASIPGHGIWYRVKVGGFKTLAEAESFLNKYK